MLFEKAELIPITSLENDFIVLHMEESASSQPERIFPFHDSPFSILEYAMGSSRGRIRWQLLGEGLLLLALASIPALMICINMVMADVTFTEATDATWGRFVICVSIVWILMALMVIAGIWYPASRAMKVQPAEALHDE